MEISQFRQRVGDAAGRGAFFGNIVELSARFDEGEKIGVGAGKGRRAQGGHDRDRVGRVVDGGETVQQIARLLRIVDEGGALKPEGDARVFERDFKCIETGATRHQNADVLIGGRAQDSAFFLRPNLPALLDRRPNCAGYGFGFMAAHDAL